MAVCVAAKAKYEKAASSPCPTHATDGRQSLKYGSSFCFLLPVEDFHSSWQVEKQDDGSELDFVVC